MGVRGPRRDAGACGSVGIGGAYRRSIVNILRALTARSRNAALMFGTCSSLGRLIATLRMQASGRGGLPLRARQWSSHVGDIAHAVQLVLDAPMPTVERQQLFGAGLCTGLAADQAGPLQAGLVGADREDFALDAGHLRGMREVHIAAQPLAGPDAARFRAAMSLVESDELRGERPPSGGLRCRL